MGIEKRGDPRRYLDTPGVAFFCVCGIVAPCVCQSCTLCNRSAGWDIPEFVWITRSNAAVRERRVIGPVNSGCLFRFATDQGEWGCSEAASRVKNRYH